MDMEKAFHQALIERPGDEAGWLVLADWLDDQGRSEQGELTRLHARLRGLLTDTERQPLEERACRLLAAGARPWIPQMTNSIGMVFVLIPPGIFWMGSEENSRFPHGEESPRHLVTITRPFYLGQHQVTQHQYEAVLGTNPSHFRRDHPRCRRLETSAFPVETVSYTDIELFCQQLAELPAEQKAGRRYRLPTEAEWEYSARAGSSTWFHVGDTLTPDQANFSASYALADEDGLSSGGGVLGRTTPVGSYAPNLFGLHDMHGNVWEWCSDWYSSGYYARSPGEDPAGPKRGERRVLRGGGWSTSSDLCRSALRGHNTVDARHNYNGFRVVLEPRVRRRGS